MSEADELSKQIDIDELARRIADRLSPESLLDAADVGLMLKVKPRYVIEEMVSWPGFPKPIRFRGKGEHRSHPRWQRADILKYIDSHREGVARKVGRPRKVVEL